MAENVIASPGIVNRILSALKKYWDRIINIGITDSTVLFDRKRVRLLNGICFVATFIYFIYVVTFLAMIIAQGGSRYLFFEFSVSCAGTLFAGIPLLLNNKKHYGFACHFFNISNIILYSYSTIIAGGLDGIEVIFVPSSVASMLFFRETRTVVIYFTLNFLSFEVVKYLTTIIPPAYSWGGQQSEVVANYVILFVVLFFIVFYFKSENARQESLLQVRNQKLQAEKKRSDDLLLNILPAETAEELKEKGSTQAKDYEMVTVMFTDFKNFTKASEAMSAQELVNQIHYCYSEFDRILSMHGIEKIKTIGDGYMAAGGLPVKNRTNPFDTVKAALSIRDFMEAEKQKRGKHESQFFDIRIGLHTGYVVAGIVGIKKFAYDIWGDTVNIASRMESSGEVGKVNISGTTFDMVKDKFTCTYRGKIHAKNKGEIDMYFVEG